MSEENVALARKAIDALSGGDFDTWLDCMSPDVVWEALEGVAGVAELYRGRGGVREWTELMAYVADRLVRGQLDYETAGLLDPCRSSQDRRAA